MKYIKFFIIAILILSLLTVTGLCDSYNINAEDMLSGTLEAPELPGEHPRLLVRNKDIATIKENLTCKEHLSVYETVLESASKEYDCILSPLDEEASTNRNGDYLQYIEANAFFYLLYEEENYATKSINGIINYLNSFEPVEISDKDDVTVTRDIGQMIFTAAEVYDWCYDKLTEDQKETIITLCVKHAENMEIGWPPAAEKAYISGHSMEAQLMKDLFSFSIAVADEHPEYYAYISDRIFNEFIPTLNYFYESSFHNQGEKYGSGRHTYELYLKWILNTIDCGEYLSSNQREIVYHFIYSRRPDGSFTSDGDDNIGIDSYYGIGPVSFLAGNLYNDPYYRQEFYRASGKKLSESIGPNNYQVSRVHFLILDNPKIGLKSISELPLSRWYGSHSGVMTARTGWEEGKDSDVLMVSMKTPERFFKGHGHLDSGEFEIYYKGPLAIDSGYYDYFGSSHDYGYNKQTIAHNSLLIINPEETSFYGEDYPIAGGQQPPTYINNTNTFEDIKGWATEYGEVLGYDYGEDLHSPSYTYLKGDLTKAYNGKAEKYTRTFMFENFFDDVYPGALIVFDKIVSDETQVNYEKKWLLHSVFEPGVDENENTITIKNSENGYSGRLINTVLLPEKDNLQIDIVGGEGEEWMVEGTNYSPTVRDMETGDYRTEISYKSKEETEYFLNVLWVSEDKDDIEPLSVQMLEADDYVGVQIKDRVSYISLSDERTENEIKISANETEFPLIYKIDNLKAGKWEIYSDNTEFTANVTSEGGVLSFVAPCGEYTLKYLGGEIYKKDLSIYSNSKAKQGRSIYVFNENYFENINVEYRYNTAYISLEEIADYFGYEHQVLDNGEKLINNDRYIVFNEGDYSVERISLYGNYKSYYTKYPPVKINNKLYGALTDCANVMNVNISYKDYMNMVGIYNSGENSNPPDTLLTDNLEIDFTVCLLDFYSVDKDKDSVIIYGIASNNPEAELIESGTLYSEKKEYPEISDVDGKTVRKYEGVNKNISGVTYFGIEFVDERNEKSSYYVRNYAIYRTSEGEEIIEYSKNSLLVFE